MPGPTMAIAETAAFQMASTTAIPPAFQVQGAAGPFARPFATCRWPHPPQSTLKEYNESFATTSRGCFDGESIESGRRRG